MADYKYECPRCNGTEVYFAKRQEITGVGGVYGNRARMVQTPLCKGCGEKMNSQRVLSETQIKTYQKIEQKLSRHPILAIGCLVPLSVFVLFWLIAALISAFI